MTTSNSYYTLSIEQTSPLCMTCVYKPGDDTEYMKINRKALSHIKSIANKLPKISLPIIHDNSEYPILKIEALGTCGLDYHLNREIFVVGQYAFFRRYNDDWSGIVIYGKKIEYSNCETLCSHPNVSWQSDVGLAFLERLDNLLDCKTNLLPIEIDQLIKEC